MKIEAGEGKKSENFGGGEGEGEGPAEGGPLNTPKHSQKMLNTPKKC